MMPSTERRLHRKSGAYEKWRKAKLRQIRQAVPVHTDLAVKEMVEGKSVAVIGRAGSLLRRQQGKQIDAAEVVIRINWVLPIPAEQIPFVGSKTDLVYHCKRARTARIEATRRGVPTIRVRGKSRRLVAREYFKKPKRFRPTTGFMAIYAALAGGAREVRLYGFDFFRSGHVQDREPDGDDYSNPLAWVHSPTQERLAMKRLLREFRGRLIADQVLKEAVS